ncbi:hypothetical protein [Flaviaesturariibacter aridisoli]|uniref:Uncharacterized protein n=1 Tax=Flaviaesturariibacter aridisoli TaxID=2545761 RepID=A0A4R4E2T9_9BACT|nr:hypothetical protein [Flaviaesturariibacter aridisoli]TCZ69902.1 hypothetical protein E0486_11740 [Flaviaesturariibacter aridisoli]
MDLEALFTRQMAGRIPALLADGNAQAAVEYRFGTNDDYLGSPLLVSLAKSVAPDEDAALLYVFQRMLAADPALAVAGPEYPGGGAFFDRLLAYGCVSGPLLHRISTEDARAVLTSLFSEILSSPESSLHRNGLPVPLTVPFLQEELLQARAFANEWNDKRYWLETASAWYFFGWSFAD